jgi:uncharacterized protein YycO
MSCLYLFLSLLTNLYAYTPQNGDLIFHTSKSSQSQAIQLATESPYSHVGIVYIQEGKPYVYEAISKVSLTPLQSWINRGTNKDYTVLRYQKVLSEAQLKRMKEVGENYKGLSYDLRFEWSSDKMYCSEVVWKIYKEGAGITLSKPKKMKDYHFDHPAVQKKLQERWKGNINWNEKVVAPSDLVDSKKLVLIETTYKQ